MPIPLIDRPVTIHAVERGWHSQTVKWPASVGHFLLEGEIELGVWPNEVEVQVVFADGEDYELFYFSLVPGPVHTRRGSYFLIERERARPVPESPGSQHDPSWSAIRKVFVRCRSNVEASVTVVSLRIFARRDSGACG